MIPRGAVATYCQPPGVLHRCVVLESGSPKSIVRDLPTGRQQTVPTHWLADTHERIGLPEPVQHCAACEAEADGSARNLFPWEARHTCRLRGAA